MKHQYQELDKETKQKIKDFNPENITVSSKEVEIIFLKDLSEEVKEALKEFNKEFLGEDKIANMNFVYQVEEMRLTLNKSLGFKNLSQDWKNFVCMLEENNILYFRIIFK